MSDHPTSETPDEGELLPLAPSDLADVQNRTDASGPIRDDRRLHGASAGRITTMLFTIAFLVAVSAALIIHNARVAGHGAQANLGWMSAQWLAEHRASHPS